MASAARLIRTGGTLLLAVAAAAILPGCDDAQNEADKQARQQLDEASQLALLGPAKAGEAAQKLKDAAQNAAASSGIRASAKAAYAQEELDSANRTLNDIDRKELDLANIEWEITQLATQIRTSASAVAGHQQFNPRPTRDAIEAKIAEAKGGPDKAAWFTNGNSVIPTLAAADKEIASLEGDLSQRQDQVKDLTMQRSRMADDAEQAAGQADQLKGDQAVMAFKRASDLRKSAGDISVQIDKLQGEIDRIQRNLSVARSQQASVNSVIAQLQERSATLDDTWKKMDAQVTAHQQLDAQILGTPGSAGSTSSSGADQQAALDPAIGGSIYQKTAQFDRLVKEIQKMRTDALTSATTAVEFFEKGHRDANELKVKLDGQINNPKNKDNPSAAIWKSAREAVDPAELHLDQAAALRTVGQIQASAASSIAARISLRDFVTAAFKDLSLTVPSEIIDGDLGGDREKALTDASAAYDQASSLLQTVIEGQASQQLQNAAKVARALTLYGWAQVAKDQGNNDAYKAHMAEARTSRDEAANNNALIPAMPTEMGPIPKPAAPASDSGAAPATQPDAAAPATQP